jgi:glycosyltransferase involved in cell wall biosynthesis
MSLKSKPLVSVILPTYNRAYILKRALDSILEQTYKALEIIVVDDGSTDNTAELVKGVGDPRIVYEKHPVNKGLAAARNTGVRKASGDYISFLDSDDEFLPDNIEEHVSEMLRCPDDVGVVYAGVLRLKGKSRQIVPGPGVRPKEGNVRQRMLRSNFLTATALIRKACYEKYGLYNEDLFNLEDWEFWIRLSRSYRFRYIDKILTVVHYTGDSITADHFSFIDNIKKIIKIHGGEFRRAGCLSNQYLRIGHHYALCGEMSSARGYFRKAAGTDKRSFSAYLAFVLSFLGRRAYATLYRIYEAVRSFDPAASKKIKRASL